MTDVIDMVAGAHNITRSDMLAPCRRLTLCRPRWLAMKLLRDRGRTLNEIGRMMRRDHATVFGGLKRANDLLREEEDFRRLYRRLSTLPNHPPGA